MMTLTMDKALTIYGELVRHACEVKSKQRKEGEDKILDLYAYRFTDRGQHYIAFNKRGSGDCSEDSHIMDKESLNNLVTILRKFEREIPFIVLTPSIDEIIADCGDDGFHYKLNLGMAVKK